MKDAVQMTLSSGNKALVIDNNGWLAIYKFGNGIPLIFREKLTSLLVEGQRTRLLCYLDINQGLGCILRETSSRIKSFGLREAIRYSYMRDMRFILCLCGMIGFSVWWAIAPDPMLFMPISLYSPDHSFLLRVVRETYIDHICSVHPSVVSPCPCGEPLNNAVRDIFDEHTSFDPLGIYNSRARALALSTLIASIILCIALAESVSPEGVYVNLNSVF